MASGAWMDSRRVGGDAPARRNHTPEATSSSRGAATARTSDRVLRSDAADALVVGREPGRLVLANAADAFVFRRQGSRRLRSDAADALVVRRERSRLFGADAPDTGIVRIESSLRVHGSLLVHDHFLRPQVGARSFRTCAPRPYGWSAPGRHSDANDASERLATRRYGEGRTAYTA